MKWQRKKFITHFKVQSQLAFIFIFWTLVLLGSLIAIFFINYSSISTDTGGMSIHDQLLTKMLLVAQAKDLMIYYGIAILAYTILIAIYVMAYAHRIVGPIHKMNMLLDDCIEKNEWPHHVRFRKGDAFHEFATRFNKFIDLMKEK